MASPESTPIYHTVFALLRSALWGEERYPFTAVPGTDWAEVYGELCHQTVEALPADILGLAADPALQMQVLARTSKRMTRWYALMKEQQSLSDLFRAHDIPFVVLKGATADIYYPQPMYRVMGDVDVIVKPEDFERAYELMKANAYEIHGDEANPRHVEVQKNGVLFELHRYFSTFNDVNYARLLDGMIFDAIDRAEIKALEGFSFPMLPPLENGLVLLEHINHHLEEGLGLRQIIDWMLYVDRELDDEFWNDHFSPIAKRLGLETLAVTTTRMCQLYLGLRENITWCRDAEEELCHELMELTMDRGNFGRKSLDSNKAVTTLFALKNLPIFCQRLQIRGCKNWKALKKYPWLKPFAWFYQICRYISKGLKREEAFSQLAQDVRKSKRQDALMERLGATRRGKGVATLEGVKVQ